MYTGRSPWTRGFLALGVAILFLLLGYRFDSPGDTLSDAFASHGNYFDLFVRSSVEPGHDDRKKKDERENDERTERQASMEKDYSADDRETRSFGDERWNAEPDGEHGASYLKEGSLPPWNLEGKRENWKSYAIRETLPAFDAERIEENRVSVRELVPVATLSKIEENSLSDIYEKDYIVEDKGVVETKDSLSPQLISNKKERNDYRILKQMVQPWNLKKNSRKVLQTILDNFEKDGSRSIKNNMVKSTSDFQETSFLSRNLDRSDNINATDNIVATIDNSSSLVHLETNDYQGSGREINSSNHNHKSTDRIIRKIDEFIPMEETSKRINADYRHYTVFSSGEANAIDKQDENLFSRTEDVSNNALNDSSPGERIDNLSHEMNEQSVNESSNSFEQTYYTNVVNELSGIISSKNKIHKSDSSESALRNVEFPNEISNDFYDRAEKPSSMRAEMEDKQDEESILRSPDSLAGTRRADGMQGDRVLFFFRQDHRLASSSAMAAESFKGSKGRAAKWDHGKMLRRGTRETRSRDRLLELNVNFREIDRAHSYTEKFEDRENGDGETREVGFVVSPVRKNVQLFDEEIRQTTDKVFGNTEELRKEFFNERIGAVKRGRRLLSLVIPVQSSKTRKEIAKSQWKSSKFEKDETVPKNNEHTNSENFNKNSKPQLVYSPITSIKTQKIHNDEQLSHTIAQNPFSNDETIEMKFSTYNEPFVTPVNDIKQISETSSEQDKLENFSILDSRKSSFFLRRKRDFHRGKRSKVRRRRHANYYSPQTATPMAYVHIQPAYPLPVPPAPNRKCVQCMVVYKPCPSATRLPSRNGFPTYKYQDLASKWRGLKYGCRCNPIGSISSACDIVTGQCQCKSHVTGRQCDQCVSGFWGLSMGIGCTPCKCDPIGSHNSSCHDSTGQCYCKPGVGGTHCDTCLPGYYGFSSNGCQVCDVCLRPGHICDPDTGRCVCPTMTYGENCDRCRPGSWDFVPGIGCRPCACTLGSMRPHCDLRGQCPCRIGYDGLRCERCAKGYYGYPRCRPCNCDFAGTLQCDGDEICDCDEDGQCPCKENAVGRQCNKCKEGTFGLAVDNPKGCTECFCFGRTTSCQQAGLSWGQRRLTHPRTLYVNDTSNDIMVFKFQSQTLLTPINGGLNVTNGLSIIPDVEGDVTIPSNLYYNYPLYWMLPESFLGDKVVSYRGFLRFTTLTEGGIPLRSSFQYPLVQLQGNNRIVLEYYLSEPTNNNHYEVRFHESLWQLQNRPDYKVTREVLMVALQNLQYILIKASDNADFAKTTLLDASLDTAIFTPTHSSQIATGIEICKCPLEYNSTSCQDPSIGYYRWYKNTTATSTIVIDLIGEAKRCQCNGRSDVCDIETGHCMNCGENTAGPRCDTCADSFYGHPDHGCKPCPCPLVDKRFSSTCMVLAGLEPICVCKPGYTGRKCERCSSGYYGFPNLPDGKCVPCNCNPAGSLSHECDVKTGQCRCKSGSTGRDCSQCTAYRHVYINNVCTSCNDNCTGLLLNTMATLSEELANGTTHIANGYIPPPWEELSYIDANVTMFFEEIDLQNKLRQRMKNIPWNDYRKLMHDVEKLFKTANENAKRADTLKSRSNDLKNNIFSSKIEMDNLRKYIEDTITTLNEYGNDEKTVEIEKALKLGNMILNNLKMINLTKKRMDLESFIEEVMEYTDWLNSLYDATEPVAVARDEIEEYSEKLNDMRNVIEDTMETLFTYDGLYNNINETLSEARNHCNEIRTMYSIANASASEGEQLTEETRGLVTDFETNIQDLPESRDKLTYWFDKLSMKEELLYRLNYEYNETYVIPAIEHVRNLSNYVDQYVSLFSETRDIAASPLKASQAYKNIVDDITAAKVSATAAKEITEDTFDKMYPDGVNSKSLLDRSVEISFESSKQLESSNGHGKLVQNTGEFLEREKNAVSKLKSTMSNIGIKDNEVNIKLQNWKNDSKKLRDGVRKVLNENEQITEDVKNTRELIEDYQNGIVDRLKPKLYELKREGDSKISLASEKLTEALSNIKKADAKLISLSNAAVKRKNAFDKWNDTLAVKLQNLKDKIAEARNTADGIRVSLRSAEGKECIRSYRPSTLQPSSTNSIVMTFALPKGKKEGSLFYLPSSINDDFLALEIVNRRVKFLWNVGGGTGIVTHPEVIESGDFQDDRFWYRIEAERIRHLGKIYVRKQASVAGKHPPVTNTTDSEYGRFDVTTTDRVWIGGIPRSQRKRSELVAPNGLPGCVHQVILDGKPVGLWNFITTAPDVACRACVEGVEDAKDDIAYSFNGEGYAVRSRVSSGPYNKYSFGVSISFKTFDENALLFLAINPDNNQHVVIFLREGKVILHIGYGGNVSMEMSSKFKYNTGNWTKVDAFRHYQLRKNIEKCSLSIGGESDKRIGAPAPQPKKEDIPDFLQAKYYIGGVPPSFRAKELLLHSQVSFLGCMANIIVEEGYDPMAEQYFGVEPTCGNKALKIVGFYGDGYLEHTSHTLRKINSTVSFSFRTMQEEAVLLLSTFDGHEDRIPIMRHGNDETNKESYYSVCVINGQIQVRLNAGRGELVITSNGTFNDGRYHSVTIIKRRKDIELRIDDAYQSAGKLPTSAAIKAPDGIGGLYFGGLPILINNTKMIATVTPLYGAIKDVIFNEQIIRFDEVVSFEHALIGRPGPSMGKDPPTYTQSASLSRGMSTQPEGCQKVPYYSLEAGALKFGDKPNSHTQLYLNFKKFWEKKYAIEFDFRTYYPNGLLFITPGLRPKHYLMVVIRDGQLLLLVKSKQKKEMLFKTPFNDGNWHHVVISHDERKLTLLVDTQTPRTIKVPRKIGLASMMYIGGLPDSGTPIPEQVVVKLETLKGCIRGLRINGNVYDMVGSTSRAYQVGQCFPNVESGAYFQDEAYAVYKRNFELGAVLELQLEFRTSELSGVLLSTTAPGNSPSLSLELNNGKVIMSGDLGDNNPLYVEQRFASPYMICDNRWHKIQAVYNDEELALKVDEMDQKYGLPTNVNYHMMESAVSGPLYIGGLPASAPKGTLMTRDHFNGCIRNVMIGGERRDWTDMDELHNIHLSSCPVQ